MKKKLAIFDMDGTLVDTVKANYMAYQAAVNSVGIPWELSEKQFRMDCFGKNYRVFLPRVIECAEDDIERIHKAKLELYPHYLAKYGKKNQSAFDILRGLSDTYAIALVTTASRKNTYDVLSLFQCSSFFDLVITSEDVERLKPDMEAFFNAVEYFSTDIKNTIIFEDSEETAVLAGKEGFTVYRVSIGG